MNEGPREPDSTSTGFALLHDRDGMTLSIPEEAATDYAAIMQEVRARTERTGSLAFTLSFLGRKVPMCARWTGEGLALEHVPGIGKQATLDGPQLSALSAFLEYPVTMMERRPNGAPLHESLQAFLATYAAEGNRFVR